jgi:hypothetical protein
MRLKCLACEYIGQLICVMATYWLMYYSITGQPKTWPIIFTIIGIIMWGITYILRTAEEFVLWRKFGGYCENTKQYVRTCGRLRGTALLLTLANIANCFFKASLPYYTYSIAVVLIIWIIFATLFWKIIRTQTPRMAH